MLVWTGDINEKFVKALLEEPSRALLLCSPGGFNYHMGAALDHLAGCDWEVRATGLSMSAAVPIVASGRKGSRSASPLCRFMVHAPFRVGGGGREETSEIKIDLAEHEYLEEVYFQALGARTALSPSRWRRLCSKGDFYFDAETAKKLGVVDSVG